MPHDIAESQICVRFTNDCIIWQNIDTDFIIAKVREKEGKELISIKGIVPPIGDDECLDLTLYGTESTNKYGKTFEFTRIAVNVPTTKTGTITYLRNAVKHVGPTIAERIWEAFGQDTFKILDETPERVLNEVNGIGPKTYAEFVESYRNSIGLRNLMLFLLPAGATTKDCIKIQKELGEEAIITIKNNPYLLAQRIEGFDFKRCDKIALKMNPPIDPCADIRLNAALYEALSESEREGNCYTEREEVLNATKNLLAKASTSADVSITELQKALVNCTKLGSIVDDNNCIYTASMYEAETNVVKILKNIANTDCTKVAQFDLGHAQTATGKTFAEKQIEAIQCACENKVLVMTGGPGTGKTTTLNGIISLFKASDTSFLLLAPTGRAARRMNESTGEESSTIHSLIYSLSFSGNEHLNVDAVIIDEFSMVDIKLFYMLLKLLPVTIKLIMVGDVDQLPSVAAGAVLRDIIDSNTIPVVRLDVPFRQEKGSHIIEYAHAINHGEMIPLSKGNPGSKDFFFLKSNDLEKSCCKIADLVYDRLPKKNSSWDGFPFETIQILAPKKNGVRGVHSLNVALKEKANPCPKGDTLQKTYSQSKGSQRKIFFNIGDKVIQTKNVKALDICNGDIGEIRSIRQEKTRDARGKTSVHQSVYVEFEGNRTVDCGGIANLDHAYAITVHKSQGSEWDCVVLPMFKEYGIMLRRQILYTAITRAKKCCVIVGSEEAVRMAIQNDEKYVRNTKLKERLIECFGAEE